MGLIGNLLGQAGGVIVGGALGGEQGRSAGQQVGGILGGLLPFKDGGKVNKTGPAYLHKGEMVVPKHLVSKVPKSVKSAMKRGGARNM
jgi:hypothetical protein